MAQLCTGSLGDPSAFISFGSDTDPFPGLTADKTSYKPATSGCPGPGEFGYRALLFNCFDNTWHTTVGDHTPNDGVGYYLLINAAGYPGTYYTDKVDGLCPGTVYEMSVWIANLLKSNGCNGKGIKPDITLQVETLSGTVLAKWSTGKIYETPSIQWKQYGTFFTTPPDVNAVVFRLLSAGELGDCGNIIAIDDIAFRPCGPLVTAAILQNNSGYIDVCEGDTTVFSMKGSYSAGFNNPVFQWQESFDYGFSWRDMPGKTSPNLSYKTAASGIQYFRFGVAEAVNAGLINCKVYSAPVQIAVNAKPFVQVTSYIFGCYGEPVVIFASGGSNYEWRGPNGFSSYTERAVIDSALYSDEGRYNIKITTNKGCFDTGSLYLNIYPAAHATIGNMLNICEGSGINLNAGGGLKYKWTTDRALSANSISNDSIANPVVNPADTTTYKVIVTNQYGCTDTAFQKVNVWKKPTVSAGNDKRTRLGIPITLDGSGTGTDIRYFWTPDLFIDNASSLRPVINLPQTAYYTLHAESNRGCGSVTDDVYIKVYDKIYVPNAFSPNGDGINDTWYIEPLDLFTDADIQVFNRYGQLVYRSQGAFKPWDGNRNGHPVPVGTYYYVLDLKIKNEKPMTGSITILR